MLDINTIEQLDKIATPFYYYDMELLQNTVNYAAEMAQKYGVKIHYAVKANIIMRGLSIQQFVMMVT